MALAKIGEVGDYNQRRYGAPWMARVINGEYNFRIRSEFTGDARTGAGGELLIVDPVVGGVYAWAQKDTRGSSTAVHYRKYTENGFVVIDKSEAIKTSYNA